MILNINKNLKIILIKVIINPINNNLKILLVINVILIFILLKSS